MTFCREHPYHIFAVGRPLHDIPIRHFRIEHGEAVMMLRSDGGVFHAGGLCQRDPRRWGKLDRIEKRRQFRVIRSIDRPPLHDPFPIPQHAIHSPVNKHSELCILKPSARIQILGGRRVILLRGCARVRRYGSRKKCGCNYDRSKTRNNLHVNLQRKSVTHSRVERVDFNECMQEVELYCNRDGGHPVSSPLEFCRNHRLAYRSVGRKLTWQAIFSDLEYDSAPASIHAGQRHRAGGCQWSPPSPLTRKPASPLSISTPSLTPTRNNRSTTLLSWPRLFARHPSPLFL